MLPVAFYSKQISGAEKQYSATELVGLAVYKSITHFTPLLWHCVHCADGLSGSFFRPQIETSQQKIVEVGTAIANVHVWDRILSREAECRGYRQSWQCNEEICKQQDLNKVETLAFTTTAAKSGCNLTKGDCVDLNSTEDNSIE